MEVGLGLGYFVLLPYLRNGLTDCHEIWHGDAGWPCWPISLLIFRKFKNPRWWRTPFWKIISISQQLFVRSAQNLAPWRGLNPFTALTVKIGWRWSLFWKKIENRHFDLTDRHHHTVSFYLIKPRTLWKKTGTPKSKEFVGVNIAPPFPYFGPKGAENPFEHKYANFCI